jgi:small-conductance mechanosensitive channel
MPATRTFYEFGIGTLPSYYSSKVLMNTTNATAPGFTNAMALSPTNTTAIGSTNETLMGQLYSHLSGHESSSAIRLALIVILAILVHLTVKSIRNLSEWIVSRSHAKESALGFVTQQPKFVTLIKLVANATTFSMYFLALGLVLQELGLDLTKYLASASIIALAISFGSQGLVQDIVIGLTLIFSDALDAGDMVEIFANTTVIGHVEEIGLRFTKLRNFYNQVVFVPNRTIANVSRFPHGGIYAYADIQMPGGVETDKVMVAIRNVVQGMQDQFGAIILKEPDIDPIQSVGGGNWQFVRVHFKIWPGQGVLIETTFRHQIVKTLQAFKPDYADWQVPVTYRTVKELRKF